MLFVSILRILIEAMCLRYSVRETENERVVVVVSPLDSCDFLLSFCAIEDLQSCIDKTISFDFIPNVDSTANVYAILLGHN